MPQLPSHILWGKKKNFFQLFAHLGVLPEIFLTTKVKQTSQPPSYVLFDISGNWYMRGPIEQLCLSPQQPAWAPAGVEREREGPLFSKSCRNPATLGAVQQSGVVVEETIPLSKAFPWEYWVTVWESSTVVFDNVSQGRLPPHSRAVWTAVPRPAEHPQSTATVSSSSAVQVWMIGHLSGLQNQVSL